MSVRLVVKNSLPASASPYRLLDERNREIIWANQFLDAQTVRQLSLRSLRAYAYDLLHMARWLTYGYLIQSTAARNRAAGIPARRTARTRHTGKASRGSRAESDPQGFILFEDLPDQTSQVEDCTNQLTFGQSTK